MWNGPTGQAELVQRKKGKETKYLTTFGQDFLDVMREKVWELDNEIHFKDTFRVFSKDEEGDSLG